MSRFSHVFLLGGRRFTRSSGTSSLLLFFFVLLIASRSWKWTKSIASGVCRAARLERVSVKSESTKV
ncbi:MAG: hypothetical protein QGG14_10085 [Planctomycetota bacterium]|nr:hypothetical protein [Planctomycetota bacterium]